MLGYIVSDKEKINVIEHEIQSFDILHKTDLNIFIIGNGKVLYKKHIIQNASIMGHVQVLEWFKRSGYEFKYDDWAINWASEYGHVQVLEWFKHSGYEFKYSEYAIRWAKNIIVLKWFIENIAPKKIIKWSKHKKINVLRFKAKKRYFKGYNKN